MKPLLYELANAAARDSCEDTIDMLTKLPDMKAVTTGWLIDYQYEPALQHEPVISKRWRFRSAHKIDSPATVEQKRQRVTRMLRPEYALV